MEDKILISLDNGKMNLKAKGEDKQFCYLNKYSLGHTSDESFLGENTYNVTYKNKDYTIGANGKFSDKNEGKASEIQIIQALTAITHFISPNEKRDIYLMYGESVDKYFDAEHKENVKQLLEGKHKINVSGVEYSFNIAYVNVLPEGMGLILQDLKQHCEVEYVVDIGGGTINFLKTIEAMPIPEESRSFKLGVNNVISKIRQKAKRNSAIGDQKEAEIRQFLLKRHTCLNKELLSIIDETINAQFDELDDELASLDISLYDILKTQKVSFIGGGADLFRNQIEKRYRSEVGLAVVVEDALFANVKGFYEYGNLIIQAEEETNTKKESE